MNTIELTKSCSLLNQYIAELRDVHRQKDALRFRRNLERVGEIMAYEISKTLEFDTSSVQTPFVSIDQFEMKKNLILCAVLRAALPFHQGFLNMFDQAECGFISAFRKYKPLSNDFDIYSEYIATPPLDEKVLILCDPMLATGKSIEEALYGLKKYGMPKHLHIASVFASRQGIEHLSEVLKEMNNVTLWCGVIDPELNSHAYIVPGLGDAGDLSFGEKL